VKKELVFCGYLLLLPSKFSLLVELVSACDCCAKNSYMKKMKTVLIRQFIYLTTTSQSTAVPHSASANGEVTNGRLKHLATVLSMEK